MARYLSESDVYNLLGERGMATVHCSQIDVLPRADVAPRAEWISVEERLPESLQRVLAINTEGDMFTAVYISFVTGKNAWSTSYSCLGVVTHWMPLPEPPDMKGGE